jgi:hypothetical protein
VIIFARMRFPSNHLEEPRRIVPILSDHCCAQWAQ